MVSIMNEKQYRLKELERKVRGLQVQLEKQSSIVEKQDRRLRNLEIKAAVKSGVPQNKVAKIFELSTARVSQITRKAV